MIRSQDILNSEKYIFTDTPFKLLMQKRIIKVLLVCSNYDAFMLEEDGQIEEILFQEYASLNLRYPPFFIHCSTVNTALTMLGRGDIDLVITMFNSEGIDVFALATEIKTKTPHIPIVALTNFSRENIIKYEELGDTSIDYVFSWLGSSDLLLAIIKLIEDKLNVERDVENVGVQVILLVEDSVRFYSSYISIIYSIMYRQTQAFKYDGLNKHRQNLLMRGRPKVLLATNFESAAELADKYKHNLLGVITDAAYTKNGLHCETAGAQFIELVQSINNQVPVVMQSFDEKNREVATKLGTVFLSKSDIDLPLQLKQYFSEFLAFGDFEFRTEYGGKVIAKASNLKELQEVVETVDGRSLMYHSSRNNFSRWLKARSQFQIAEMLEPITPTDFADTELFRKFLINAISLFRLQQNRSGVAHFIPGTFDQYVHFSRSGSGSMGGKARGLAFAETLLHKYGLSSRYNNVLVTVPRTVVLCSEHFDAFMQQNNLYEVAYAGTQEEMRTAFEQASLPGSIKTVLQSYAQYSKRPVAVRSSSVLEDSHYCSFAGVYHTKMVNACGPDWESSYAELSRAVKAVYASVFAQSSKDFFAATSNVLDEEKMSVVLQDVCGEYIEGHYFPTFSGVAASHNYYPLSGESVDGGVCQVAMGLGSYIVQGAPAVRFSPVAPQRSLHFSIPQFALQNSQKKLHAISSVSQQDFCSSGIEELNHRKFRHHPALRSLYSVFDYQTETIKDSEHAEGMPFVSFSKILQYDLFPLAQIVHDILTVGAKEMNCPVEIEFAVQMPLDNKSPVGFNLLQLRPMSSSYGQEKMSISNKMKSSAFCFSVNAMGNGKLENIRKIVLVSPECFKNAGAGYVVDQLKQINAQCINNGEQAIFIGPGRWGSTDTSLGIPVQWTDISSACAIVETPILGKKVDPSNGSHFFHNMVNLGVFYLHVDKELDLSSFPQAEEDSKAVLVIENQFHIVADGKNREAAILMDFSSI